MDIGGAIRRHPGRSAVVAIVGLGLVVLGFLWFRPDRLFVDQVVNEALPGAPPAGAVEEEAEERAGGARTAGKKEEQPETAAEPVVLARSLFISLEHATRGRALIVQTPTGARFLRFEDFETSNGPDLVVYLSAKRPSGPDDWRGYDQDFVDLGPLKGNIGDQNYRVPKGVDLDRYPTAVVWCRRFTVGFAAAVLG